MKTLVVYYSRSGNTEKAALEKAEEIGADFLQIDTIEDVFGPQGFMKAGKMTVLGREMILMPYEKDIKEYDRFILCSPIWAGKVSLPMKKFAETEKDNINSADYLFTHGGKSMKSKPADELDKILGIKRGQYESVQMILKKKLNSEIFI
jgi:flavodoxin